MSEVDLKKRASSLHLTHEHAAFHGCTNNEGMFIFLVWMMIEIPVLLLFSWWISRYMSFLGALFIAVFVMSLITGTAITRMTAKIVGRMRRGRPPAYVSKAFSKIRHEKLGTAIPYLTHTGTWSIRRQKYE